MRYVSLQAPVPLSQPTNPPMSSIIKAANRQWNKVPRWAIGIAAATPVFAIVQASVMLTEYRKNHGHAPFPISPSRGIVVMKTEVKGEETPLRVLVIGDSLAAGVGTSHSGTPVLPESIARGLSQSLGRAVSWTCVGTPGASSAQIVQAILTMDDSPNMMEKKLIEWQATGRRAQEWLQQLLHGDDVSRRLDDLQPAEDGGNRIKLWWEKIRKTITDFRAHVVEKHADENDALTKRLLLEHQLVRQESIQVDPEQFDIAVVLTGVNDVKFAFLPFMMDRSNSSNSQGNPKQTSGEGLRNELQRVLVALKSRMNLDFSKEEKESKDSISETTSLPSALAVMPSKKRGRGPLVVFPAMPAEPIPLFQCAPLSWFLIPLIKMMDANKKYLADRYPDMVLYVESPSNETIRRFERGEGSLFAARTAEQILVTVTDVTEQAKRRVEDLMQKHYQRWTTDRECDDQEQSCSSRDAFSQQCHDHLPPRTMTNPGSTMMSPDRVHPNDNGYDFWGRHIAAAIVKEWQKDAASK